jgi:hypothetical protein
VTSSPTTPFFGTETCIFGDPWHLSHGLSSEKTGFPRLPCETTCLFDGIRVERSELKVAGAPPDR